MERCLICDGILGDEDVHYECCKDVIITARKLVSQIDKLAENRIFGESFLKMPRSVLNRWLKVENRARLLKEKL